MRRPPEMDAETLSFAARGLSLSVVSMPRNSGRRSGRSNIEEQPRAAARGHCRHNSMPCLEWEPSASGMETHLPASHPQENGAVFADWTSCSRPTSCL